MVIVLDLGSEMPTQTKARAMTTSAPMIHQNWSFP
jgi:hypothetical protein